jgi:hypothetical protein
VNLYPSQYQLPELTAHLVALLERRRAAVGAWDAATEAAFVEEARAALAEAGAQFREVADDPAHWQRVTEQCLTVALPRYLKLAREEHALEARKYGVWRGGDFLSRAAYAVGSLLVGALLLRTALPRAFETLPLVFFVGGPLIPDVQTWLARRRYARALATLVEDMRLEELDRSTYQPLGIDAGATGEVARAGRAEEEQTKTR